MENEKLEIPINHKWLGFFKKKEKPKIEELKKIFLKNIKFNLKNKTY